MVSDYLSERKKTKIKMAGEVLVDALPYHDKGYDEPGEKEAVIFHIFIKGVYYCTFCSGSVKIYSSIRLLCRNIGFESCVV